MSEPRVLRCTHCGLRQKDQTSDILITCKACGIEYLANDGILFSSKDSIESETIKKIRLLLGESVLYNDINAIKTYSSDILKIIPDDLISKYFYAYAFYFSTTPKMMYNFISKVNIVDSARKIRNITEHMVNYLEVKEKNLILKFIEYNDNTFLLKSKDILENRIRIEENYLSVPRDIFISYRSTEIDQTIKVVESLESNGFTCWFSNRNLRPDDNINYWQNIEEAINLSSIVLVISSQAAMLSRDIHRELVFAKKNKKCILEYKIDNIEHNIFFRNFFDGIKWINAIDKDNFIELNNRVYDLIHHNKENHEKDHSLVNLMDNGEFEKIIEITNDNLSDNPYDANSWLYQFLAEIKVKSISDINPNKLEDLPKSFYRAKEYNQGEIKNRLIQIERLVHNNSFEIMNSKIVYYKGQSKRVVIPEGINEIGAYAFVDNKIIRSIELSQDVKIIEEGAFQGCINLESFLFNENLISIKNNAFENCKKITSVRLPSNLLYLGSDVFKNSGLISLKIPNSIEYLEANLTSSTVIKEVFIGKNVSQIDPKTFNDSSLLVSLDVHPENLNYKSLNGVLYDYNISKLIKYPCNMKNPSYRCPNSLVIIGKYAFENSINLVLITFNEYLRNIESRAFYNSQSIEKIEINGEYIEIDEEAFSNMLHLKNVKLNSSHTKLIGNKHFSNSYKLNNVEVKHVEEISPNCFENNISLFKISLPKDVKQINSKAFYRCKLLREISIPSTCKVFHDSFDGIDSLKILTFDI